MHAAVFGAQGSVGAHVTAGLRAAGVRVRATGRHPDPATAAPGVELVAADLTHPQTLPPALDGVEKAFLYAVPLGIDGFVAAAKAAGVRHVVLLSSAAIVNGDASRNPIAVQHRTIELAIEASGMDWTFIRPGMFATNTRWWWTKPIRAESPVRLPYPQAQTAPIHEKDIAAAAVTALIEPGHAGRAYTVYGPQSLTLREQIESIGAAIGREIAIEVISPQEARTELGRTMPPAGVEAIMRIWTAGKTAPARTSTIVEELTGSPAHTFAQWAADHADDFR